MGKRLMDVVAWLGAAIVATGLLIGAPLLLLAAGDGWPGPTSVPTAEQVGEFLTTRLSDENLIAVFVIVGWLLWAHFVFVFVVEFVNQLRDRQSKELHTAAITQRAARFIVTGLFRLGATSTAILGVVGPGATAGAVVMMSTQAGAQELPEGVTIDADPQSDNPTTTTTLFGSDDGTSSTFVMADPNVSPRDGKIPYLVEEDDTLWDISERHTGDPQRWREVFDASQGFTQPGADDRVLEHPRLINPGMVLLLPGDAVDVPAVDEALVEAVYGPSTVTTDRLGIGPVGSAPEATAAEITETEQAVEAAAAEAQAGASYEDQIGAQTTEPAGAVAEAPAESVAPPTSMPEPVVDQIVDFGSEDAIQEAGFPAIGMSTTTAAFGFGAGGLLFATFMAMRLKKSGRWARSKMYPGEHQVPVDAESAEIEREAYSASDYDHASFYGRAWRSLASRPMEPASTCQPLLAIRHNDDLQVLMSEPNAEAPFPWTCASVEDDRAVWTLPMDKDTMGQLPELDGGAGLPLMVTVGENAFLNLEAVGPFDLVGDAGRMAGLARSMMWEVAVSPWIDGVDIRMTEAAAARLGLEGGENAVSLAQEVSATTALGSAAIEGYGMANIHAARAILGAENLPSLVIADVSDEQAIEGVLLAAREARLSLGVVVLDGRSGSYSADLEYMGNLTLAPSGLRCRSAFAEVDRAALFAELEQQRMLLRKVVDGEAVIREVPSVYGPELAEVSVVAGSVVAEGGLGSAVETGMGFPDAGFDLDGSFEPIVSPPLSDDVELPEPPTVAPLQDDAPAEPTETVLSVFGRPGDRERLASAEGADDHADESEAADELAAENVMEDVIVLDDAPLGSIESPESSTHVATTDDYEVDAVSTPEATSEPEADASSDGELVIVDETPMASEVTSTDTAAHVATTDDYEVDAVSTPEATSEPEADASSDGELVIVDETPMASEVTSTDTAAHVATTDDYEVSADDVIDLRDNPTPVVADGTLLVQLLGTPQILGETKSDVSDMVLSFVAVLALEGEQSRDDMKRAIYKEGSAVAETTWRSLTSRVRRQIELSNFPRVDGEIYRMMGTVTDFGVLMSKMRDADQVEDDDERLALMIDALALIRGEPFGTGKLSKYWSWVDMLASQPRVQMECVVSDAVSKAAELALRLGRNEDALEIVRKGLLANPFGEWLITTEVETLIKLDRRSQANEVIEAYEQHCWEVFALEPSTRPRDVFDTTREAS